MIFIFSLFLKVFFPNDIKDIRKKHPSAWNYMYQCFKDESKWKNVNGNTYHGHTFIYCTGGSDFTMSDCYYNSIITQQSDSYLIYVQKVNFNLLSTRIYNSIYHTHLIFCHGATSNHFKMSSCTVNSCYNENNAASNLIMSDYKINTITDNTVEFSSHSNSAQAFLIFYHTNCIFTGNKVKNAYFSANIDDRGAGFSTVNCEGSTETLKFQDCTFDNCRGSNPSVISLRNILGDLTITRLILKNIEKTDISGGCYHIVAIGYPGYSFYKLTFQSCEFYNIQSNTKYGAGIGLFFGHTNQGKDLSLNFYDSKFENIKRYHNEYGGGAISVTPFIDSNAYSHHKNLVVLRCHFSQIYNYNTNGYLSDQGGAIYYYDRGGYINLNSCHFTSTNANDAHALYLHFNSYSTTCDISSCTFTDCGANCGSSKYCIIIDAYSFSLKYNTFKFTYPAQCCKVIKAISSSSSIRQYVQNTFQNFYCNSQYESSSL